MSRLLVKNAMLRGNAAEPEVKEEMASSSVRVMSLFLSLISDALSNTVQPDSVLSTQSKQLSCYELTSLLYLIVD